MKKQFTILTFALLVLPFIGWGQTLKGNVTSADGPVIGATVRVSSSQGTTTDANGEYTLNLAAGTYKVSINFIGYKSQSQSITLASGETQTWNVTLMEDITELADIIVTGARSVPRSSIDTPLPVDVFSSKDLLSTGQPTFDKALQYRVPSFNTVQTPVNDATSLLDPYELRNMGPSRTLILINGKRKNMSSLLYTQTSPGRGETGADISAIPADAIKRVEILRDGASAQYGSDAIAGVMNIILKDEVDNGGVTLRTSITGEGDGEMFGIALNNGVRLGQNGFLNYTIDMSKVSLANRPGTVDAAGEAADFGANISDVNAFLAKMPDAGNINGSPETTAAKFEINGGSDLGTSSKIYFNAAYIYKKVNSFANYRTPYWRTVTDFPYLQDFFPGPNGSAYQGYVPTFDGDLNDYNATIGFKSEKNGWNSDVSLTVGGNSQVYTVTNSHNRSDLVDGNGEFIYQENSPITFKPGGTAFNHLVGNIDVSKSLSDRVSFAFGTEFRSENFEVIEGDLASYDGVGADSFAGNTPANSFHQNRYNFGGYVDFAFDLTDDFLINATARAENYSDFGGVFVWKVSSRYKLADDKVTLRASVSTGFRAPTLHQIYTQKVQYSFVPGEGIQSSGLINNVSKEARLEGVPSLDSENSVNFTFGLGARPVENLTITLDYYNIKVNDRIVLSDELPSSNPAISSISYFTNGIDTRTSGIDYVINYNGLANGDLGISLAGNYQLKNEREGDLRVPGLIGETQEALMFTSRPKTKAILGITYDIGKFGFALYNTYFGKTQFAQSGLQNLETTYTDYDPANYDANGKPIPGTVAEGRGDIDGLSDLRTEFKPKFVTDLSVNYSITEKVNLTLNLNNIFNVLPEWKFIETTQTGKNILNGTEEVVNSPSNLITFNQRYSQMTYDGYHFSQLGSIYALTLNFKF